MKRRVEPTVAAPRREGPTITHGDRIAMDLMKPGPAIPVTGAGPGGSQPMMLAKPGSELPGQPKPALPATTLVRKSRKGLMTGVTFLLDHGAPPPPEEFARYNPDGAGPLVVRARIAQGTSGSHPGCRTGRWLVGVRTAGGRRRGAGQSRRSIQRQANPASDRRRYRGDRGTKWVAGRRWRSPGAA